VTQQPEDDFEYWMRLKERKEEISEVVNLTEEQLQRFAKIVAERGFRCATYHIFPFDTRVISVVIGNYGNNPRSFAISLEDIRFADVGHVLYVPITRVYSWEGECDNPDRKGFKTILETKEERKIDVFANGLLAELERIYHYIAERFNLPPL